MEEEILIQIYESLRKGKKVALATITQAVGSTPGKTGSIMAIWEDCRILGSVGGGKIESVVIARALECMKKNEDTYFDYKLNEQGELGMQCGGDAKGFIKVFKPKPRLIIVGGGHTGKHLFKLAKTMGFYIAIFDDREEFANKERFEDADEIIAGDLASNLSNYNITEDTYIVLVSKGHKTDIDSLRAVIGRGAAYIGMMGSARKTILVVEKLSAEGIAKEELRKIYTPIGLNISGESPEEIAFGILAEIMLIKNKGSLNHRKDLKKLKL